MVVVVRGFPQVTQKGPPEVTTFSLDDVGCLVTRNNSGVSGKVHVVKNSNQLWISQFNFEKAQENAFFNIGMRTFFLFVDSFNDDNIILF